MATPRRCSTDAGKSDHSRHHRTADGEVHLLGCGYPFTLKCCRLGVEHSLAGRGQQHCRRDSSGDAERSTHHQCHHGARTVWRRRCGGLHNVKPQRFAGLDLHHQQLFERAGRRHHQPVLAWRHSNGQAVAPWQFDRWSAVDQDAR